MARKLVFKNSTSDGKMTGITSAGLFGQQIIHKMIMSVSWATVQGSIRLHLSDGSSIIFDPFADEGGTITYYAPGKS